MNFKIKYIFTLVFLSIVDSAYASKEAITYKCDHLATQASNLGKGAGWMDCLDKESGGASQHVYRPIGMSEKDYSATMAHAREACEKAETKAWQKYDECAAKFVKVKTVTAGMCKDQKRAYHDCTVGCYDKLLKCQNKCALTDNVCNQKCHEAKKKCDPNCDTQLKKWDKCKASAAIIKKATGAISAGLAAKLPKK